MLETRHPTEHIVLHALIGELTIAHVQQASGHVLRSPIEGVIWDLRQSDLDCLTYSDALAFGRSAAEAVVQGAAAKRGFVINTDAQREVTIMVLGHIQPAWQWQIFESMDDAIDWVCQ